MPSNVLPVIVQIRSLTFLYVFSSMSNKMDWQMVPLEKATQTIWGDELRQIKEHASLWSASKDNKGKGPFRIALDLKSRCSISLIVFVSRNISLKLKMQETKCENSVRIFLMKNYFARRNSNSKQNKQKCSHYIWLY